MHNIDLGVLIAKGRLNVLHLCIRPGDFLGNRGMLGDCRLACLGPSWYRQELSLQAPITTTTLY